MTPCGTPGRALRARRWTVATAESCTGGLIAGAITDVAGSSAWFDRGFVTYSNEAKIEMLGVRAETLAAHGAVSEATAREMAPGALSRQRRRRSRSPSPASPVRREAPRQSPSGSSASRGRGATRRSRPAPSISRATGRRSGRPRSAGAGRPDRTGVRRAELRATGPGWLSAGAGARRPRHHPFGGLASNDRSMP